MSDEHEGELMSTIIERVARGAAFLDEKHPHWWREVNLDQLDIASYCGCILGQLAGITVNRGLAYQWAADQFGVTYCNEIELGFEAPSVRGTVREWEAAPGEYADLTMAWRDLIKGRCEAEWSVTGRNGAVLVNPPPPSGVSAPD